MLLVDDLPAVRKTLRTWLELEPDIEILGEACDGESALESAQSLSPDVILMDVKLPDTSGIQVTAILRQLLPATRIVVLSLYDDPDTRNQALTAGAAAFVGKGEADQALLPAIRKT